MTQSTTKRDRYGCGAASTHHSYILRVICALVALIVSPLCMSQTQSGSDVGVALKTNLLSDLLLAPAAEVEIYWGREWSTSLGGTLTWLSGKTRTWRIRKAQLSGKYWIAPESRGIGYYVGVYGEIMDYDVRLGKEGYLGRTPHYGAGLIGGRGVRLSSHVTLDLSLSLGYLSGEYHRYRTGGACDCADVIETQPLQYFGLTGGGVSLAYRL